MKDEAGLSAELKDEPYRTLLEGALRDHGFTPFEHVTLERSWLAPILVSLIDAARSSGQKPFNDGMREKVRDLIVSHMNRHRGSGALADAILAMIAAAPSLEKGMDQVLSSVAPLAAPSVASPSRVNEPATPSEDR